MVRGEDVRIKRPEQFVREFRIVSTVNIEDYCLLFDNLTGLCFSLISFDHRRLSIHG